MKKRKQTGKGCKSASENDETVTKMLAACRDLTEVAENVIAYRAAHPIVLSVPDAWTMEEFLKKAKQVYREAHPPHLTLGRRAVESVAIDKLTDFWYESGRQPTQGAMIKLLIDDLKLSKNTAGKYAKLYRLSRQDMARLSQADQRWLCKKFGSESLSPGWWDNRFWQRFGEKVATLGLGEKIRKILAGKYTEAELRQKIAEMVRLKDERIAERIALRRQQADAPIAKDGLTKEPRPRPKRSRKSPG